MKAIRWSWLLLIGANVLAAACFTCCSLIVSAGTGHWWLFMIATVFNALAAKGNLERYWRAIDQYHQAREQELWAWFNHEYGADEHHWDKYDALVDGRGSE